MTSGGLLFVFVAGACVLLGAACGGRVGLSARADTSTPAGLSVPVSEGLAPLTAEEDELNRRPLKLPLNNPRILVEKGARRLKLYAGGELVRVRVIALGFAPEGDKVRQGDGRTPEGEYKVCMKNERSSYYLSLGLTYPNASDAERGLRDGLITKAQHKSIQSALEAGRCPPWNTTLGGEIFIHGGGNARDWTWGCVALENPEIKELFDTLPKGTLVQIKP